MKVANICTTSLSHKILVDKLSVLESKGYEVHLISAKEGFNNNLFKHRNINLRFVEMKREIAPLSDLVSIIRLVRLLKKERYDIVHTHTAKAGIIGRISGKLAGVPIVIHTSHGLPYYEGQSKVKYKVYEFFEKVASIFCDAIGSQNTEDIEKIKRNAVNKEVFYEGNGVDLALLDNYKQNITLDKIQKMKKELDIPPEKIVILVGARFEPVKNHKYLISSLKELNKTNDNFICLLAGQGDLEKEIRKQVVEAGLKDQVRFLGYQSYIYPFIKMADIIALTSEKEGLPRIIMEAMAFKKPVIGSDVLGTRELVNNDVNGYLVEYENVNEMAKKLDNLLEDDLLRSKFGANGREILEKQFTEQIVVDRIVDKYKQLSKKA
ncbi:glycosyltransferase family 4 protein [Halobacillus salinus]|nr:glycosyltransferase family 4 protein [Halobacillus salinus]